VPLDRRLGEVFWTRCPRWAVCAVRSGRFAGAVFRGCDVICHKAFHRYTVRAKAGGSQSTCDNSGKNVKSAGSSLRRHGEQRLAEEIKEIMTEKWAQELASCDLIFVSVSKRMKSTLVGTEHGPFIPHAKVRRLPFMVGRPTFAAVREAHIRVASVVFADARTADTLAAPFRPAPEKPTPAATILEGPLPAEALPEPPPPAPKYSEEEDELFTPLHSAAAAGEDEKILELLDDGADPQVRDGKGRVPYYLCTTNKAREAFRRWRGDNEDVWDWQTAQVPEGITEESEQRKKRQRERKAEEAKRKTKSEQGQGEAGRGRATEAGGGGGQSVGRGASKVRQLQTAAYR